MWISPDLWILFLARKGEVQSGITPSLVFVPIHLAVIASLKNSSPEAVAAHNKCCQDQANTHLSITDPVPPSPGKQVDNNNEDENAPAPALQPSGYKPSSSPAGPGFSLTSTSAPAPSEVPPDYPMCDLGGLLSW